MSLKENFAAQLKLLRSFHGKTTAEFSTSIGIAKSSLQSFESGEGNPTLDTISLIAQNLDVDDTVLVSPPDDLPLSKLDASRLLLASVPAFCMLRRERRSRALRLISELTDLFD